MVITYICYNTNYQTGNRGGHCSIYTFSKYTHLSLTAARGQGVECQNHTNYSSKEPYHRGCPGYCCQNTYIFLEFIYLQSTCIFNCGVDILQRASNPGNPFFG